MFLFYLLFHIFTWYSIINNYFKKTLKNIRNENGYGFDDKELYGNKKNYDINLIFYILLANYSISLILITTIPIIYFIGITNYDFFIRLNFLNYKFFILSEFFKSYNSFDKPNMYKFYFIH